MSLREIRSHNKYEIMTMLAALNRFHILESGQGITEDMRRKGPEYANLYNAYLKEIEKYRKQRGIKDVFDDSDSDIKK